MQVPPFPFPTLQPKPLPPQVFSNIRHQNEKSLELLSVQLNLFSDLAKIQDLDEFKSRLQVLSANLQCLTESVLKSHRSIVEIMDANGIKKEEVSRGSLEEEYKVKAEEAPAKDVTERILALEEENAKMKEEFIELKEKMENELKEKNEEIEKLTESLSEKNELIEKGLKFKEEKEILEKNVEVLVGLNEKVKKNYEQTVVDLETQKSRCKVLMDINLELRDSLEIVLHENNKLNFFFNPEIQKKFKEEEDQEE